MVPASAVVSHFILYECVNYIFAVLFPFVGPSQRLILC